MPETAPDRLGVFGGTFNPLHHGHLIAVQEASHQLGLAEVLFVPAPRPPHRDAPGVDPNHRLEMTRRALQDRDAFRVSDVEYHREGPSYTVDTLRALSEDHPDRDLVLLVGADELVQFRSWHRWEAVLERAEVVGMSRPGFERSEVPDPVRGRCFFVETPEVDVSSTRVRRRIREGAPARSFVPRSVWEYIREHGLYGGDEG